MRYEENKLSVIIPIFNVEKYLPKCLESVINQTFKNMEIILIDDGATDDSGKICDQYGKCDKRIKVIHKKNEGTSCARNVGIDIATGKYISFLDSDDWIEPEMYETLIRLLEENNIEMACCGFKRIYENRSIVYGNTGIIKFYDIETAINSLIKEEGIRFELWNKVFYRDIIGDIRFKNNQVFEEVYFDRKILMRIKNVVYIDKPMHNYLMIREGNTNSHFKNAKLGVFKELDDFIKELKEFGLMDSAQRIEAYALHTAISLYLDACELETSKNIKNQLISEHAKYHGKIKQNKYINRKKSNIFKISPRLYRLLAKVRNFIRSITKNKIIINNKEKF